MSPPSDRRRLDSWKEIASHLGRTVRTVQRWERDEGLPVHRHAHQKLSSVYAFSDELDRWWAQSKASSVPDPGARPAAPAAEHAPQDRPDPPAERAPGHLPSPPLRSRPSLTVLAATTAVTVVALAVVTIWQSDVTTSAVAATTAVPPPPASDADALYRRGRSYWQQRTPRGFEEARQTFEAALAADPNHAGAHAGLADTYSLLESFGLMAPDDALTHARAEAERALELAPQLGEAHASLAFVLWERHDTSRAMLEMERALELDPSYATAHHWYGLFLQQFLRRDEAIAEARRAVALDPTQPVFWTDLASLLKAAQRLDEAEAVLREAGLKHQGFPEIYIQLSDLALARGDPDQAVVLLRRAVALGDNRARIVSRLGCLEGTTGHPAGVTEALHLLRDMEATGRHVPDDALAALLAWTGDLEGAFRHIRRGLDQRQDWVSAVHEASGCFEPLRRDPRWTDLVNELEGASWLPLGSRPRPRTRADGPRAERPPLSDPSR